MHWMAESWITRLLWTSRDSSILQGTSTNSVVQRLFLHSRKKLKMPDISLHCMRIRTGWITILIPACWEIHISGLPDGEVWNLDMDIPEAVKLPCGSTQMPEGEPVLPKCRYGCQLQKISRLNKQDKKCSRKL